MGKTDNEIVELLQLEEKADFKMDRGYLKKLFFIRDPKQNLGKIDRILRFLLIV